MIDTFALESLLAEIRTLSNAAAAHVVSLERTSEEGERRVLKYLIRAKCCEIEGRCGRIEREIEKEGKGR